MVSPEGTVLTDRQLEVLELRERGHTQQEVADRLGTTDSNVSAIERAAEENIRKAERTIRLIRAVRSPVRFTVARAVSFETLVDEVYAQGDDANVKVSYCRPELKSHLRNKLGSCVRDDRLAETIEVGLTEDGNVSVFIDELPDRSHENGKQD